jgi:hypothetical protein
VIIPDTNLLVFTYNDQDPNHPAALRWWQGLANGSDPLGVDWSIIVAFMRVSTLRSVVTDPPDPQYVASIVESWFEIPHMSLIEPGPDHLKIVTELLAAAGRGGNLVPDAHIAALAIQHEAEVHTNDRDFSRFPGLRWRNPLAETA